MNNQEIYISETVKAKVIDIVTSDGKSVEKYAHIPNKFLHSKSVLNKKDYSWYENIHVSKVTADDTIVVIDTFAYRVRKENGQIIRLKTGGYPYKGKFFVNKIVAVLRNDTLSIVVEDASPNVIDINPYAPLRAKGVHEAERKIQKMNQNN